MAEHQPGVRAQHRDMVGDGLGVGRADADIDHGDAAMILALQMIGRHLRQPRGAIRPRSDCRGLSGVIRLPGSTKNS
jgi:hypothetical protein